MRQSSLFIFTVLIVQAYSAPQLITFSEGKLGVNFGGYHAGVGIGGAGGKGGTAGGLYAEAGTPFGPAAKAGLGGSVDGNSGTAGGLYAGATAGGNVNAAAGLGGVVAGGKAVGGGYSTANAGSISSSSVLGGEKGASGSFSVSAHKSIGVPTVVKETEISVVPVQEVKTGHKKIHSETSYEVSNEISPGANVQVNGNFNVDAAAQPFSYIKEFSKWRGPHYRTRNFTPVDVQDIMSSLFRIPQRMYSQQTWLVPPHYNYVPQVNVAPIPTQVIVHKHKPHRHHVHKTVYVGGYVGAGGEVAALPPKTVVVKAEQPINKKVDVEAHGGSGVTINGKHVGPGKTVTFSNSQEVFVSNKPNTFFQDIFNIPISTLKAVSGFLSNTAGNTNISVQKSASVHAGGYSGFSGQSGVSGHTGYSNKDLITPKHVPLSSSSSSSSEAHISVQTPSASKFIDDIFSIPINTLSAVNTFLENNVAGRKRVQVSAEGAGEPTRVRLGPYARRRANKHVVIVQDPNLQQEQESN